MPRLPVFGWAAFSGSKRTDIPCILDAREVAFTSSGCAAIALALRNLGVGPGDRVLVPTYHCPTMIAPVATLGALPLFFPIDSMGRPVIDAIEGMDLSRVRAMIAAHYFGFPQPMAPVRHLCDAHGIGLIEDCAHAMFGRSAEGSVGTSGDYAIASLTKFFPVADGGCLISSSRHIDAQSLRPRTVAEEVRSAANTLEIGAMHRRMPGIDGVLGATIAAANAVRGSRRLAAGVGSGFGETLRETRGDPSALARNSNMGSRASAWSHWIARAASRERIVALRRRNYQHLAAMLANIRGTRVLLPELPEFVVPYVLPLWIAAPEQIYQRVRAAGIPVFRWDDVWPDVPSIPGDVGPEWSDHVFQLACHQDLGLADLGVISDTLTRIISEIGS